MSTIIRMVDNHTGVFSQLKLSDGNRILISFTQTEVAVFKLAFFGTVPTTKIWSLSTKECLAFINKNYGTAKPLGVITNKATECYFLSELPLFLNKFFLINNEDKKEGGVIKNENKTESGKSGVKSISDLVKYLMQVSVQGVSLAVEEQNKKKGSVSGKDEAGLNFQTSIFLSYFLLSLVQADTSLNDGKKTEIIEDFLQKFGEILNIEDSFFETGLKPTFLMYKSCRQILKPVMYQDEQGGTWYEDPDNTLYDVFGDMLCVVSSFKKTDPVINHLMQFINFYSSKVQEAYRDLQKNLK